MEPPADVRVAVDELIDEYRSRCLWFLRSDYYPTSVEERLRALDYIERYGDRAAFQRAASIRRWLLPTSNALSAGS